tara:strand:- start:62 stop:313 length:252 start_codon:yes stop_codon:yes gene_type:complete
MSKTKSNHKEIIQRLSDLAKEEFNEKNKKLDEEIQKENHIMYKLILGLILVVAGSVIIITESSWFVFVGIFLLLWGDNLQQKN